MSKLKTTRQAKGLSQSQLAEKANMNVRTLQHYEQGSKVFDHARIDTILRVCLALNCKFEDIIENQEYIDLIKRYKDS
jgi:transcriptional regulator with XRE-family HTH domain